MTDAASVPVYLNLFHGRDDPEQNMDDWGFRGPTLGPMLYVQVTYMCEIKFSMEREAFIKAFPDIAAEWMAKGFSNIHNDWIEHHISAIDHDLIPYDGKFYGDWSVTAAP